MQQPAEIDERSVGACEAGATLLLWAADSLLPPPGDVILWQGTARLAQARSIAEYLEQHAEQVRRRYLSWAHELGELSIHGRKLRERFKLADGSSFWWYSVFVEQSAWKQRSLEPLLKLFALELLLDDERPAQLHFVGSDRALGRALRRLCEARRMSYRWSRLTRRPSLRRGQLIGAIPNTLQGFLTLIYWCSVRLRLGRPAEQRATGTRRRALICGPFANHNATTSAKDNEFISAFWGPLPPLLRTEGYQVDWLHLFHRHDKVPSARRARQLLPRTNLGSPHEATHCLVESYLTASAVTRIFWRWLALSLESVLLGIELRSRDLRHAGATYWPLLRADWARAFRGVDCVQNLLFLECFERALSSRGRYDECLYLMENQSWERALARAWRRHGHGRLTGVAHSTLRFWDLRYHCDPRRYDPSHGQLPRPDCVALNGRAAHWEYVASCGHREALIECEALRYLHLVPARACDLSELRCGSAVRLLVLGDYTRARTEALLALVAGVLGRTRFPLELLIKPHPSCPIDALPFDSSSCQLVTQPVAALATRAHLVLASNTTSAALEAYVCGARMLVLDDHSSVNYSPLRGVPGAIFVRDSDELCRAVDALDLDECEDSRRMDEFFHVDRQLPRWRRYFDLSQGAGQASTPAQCSDAASSF